jgi:hypothetical protein
MQLLFSSIIIFGLLANLGLFMSPTLSVDIQENQAVLDYPEQIKFSLKASSDEVIESVELVFGSDVITCGESLTRAFPEDYEPSKEVDVEWEWTLRRSGTLPPGAQVWWEWKLTDAQGNEILTPRKSLTFTDESIPWQLYHSDSLEINWVEGDQAFARDLAEAGETALDSLFEITGVELEEVVRVYIYPSSEEMQTATLFAPDWSGGLAFAEYRTVLAGVSPDDLTWGREVVAHELTHVLIGVYAFSCVSVLPIWLNEGLAMYAETSVGSSHDAEYNHLYEAVDSNTLLTVREVSSIFSNDPDLARQAYAQSLSLVQYLIDEYGQEKMLAFLDAFRDGFSQDQALSQVYGLDQDSLNDAWREWIGAEPLKGTAIPEATATRTPYPTIPPITGPSGEVTSTSPPVEEITKAEPTVTLLEPSTEEAPEPVRSGSSGLLFSIVGGTVLVLMLIAGFVLLKRYRSIGE